MAMTQRRDYSGLTMALSRGHPLPRTVLNRDLRNQRLSGLLYSLKLAQDDQDTRRFEDCRPERPRLHLPKHT